MFIQREPATNPRCPGRHGSHESSNRLNGGNSDNGGLSNVNNDDAGNRNDNIGFRPSDVSREPPRRYGVGRFVPEDLIHPPSIRPTSISGVMSVR